MTVDESKALTNGARVYWRGDAADSGAAIICVTHDEMILDRFDHIFRLRDGRLEPEKTVDADSEHMSVG